MSTLFLAFLLAGSTVAAGGDITIRATGAGANSDLTVQGGSIKAGHNVSLQADDQINLLAAQSTADQHSTNKSISGSIGFSVGAGGMGITVSASGARGNADGSDVTQANTHVEAGQQLNLQSGGDTTLKGAVAKATQVNADIGGNLHIESLQDTSKFDSKQKSIGGSVTMGAGVSGSFSASKSKVNSDYASVTEQSGIQAGDGGFNVNVTGNTDLKGGAITSTQAAIDSNANQFATGGVLTTSDIQNQASYSAKSVGINVGSGFDAGGKLAPSGTSAGFGADSGAASSITTAAISGIAGNKDARTGDVETSIHKIFDADKVQKNIDAQVQITQTFGREAPKAVASFAQSQSNDLKTQAKAAADAGHPDQARALIAEAKKWDDGGMYRIAIHTATGALTGGIDGALGAASVAGAAPLLNELQGSIAKSLLEAGAGDKVAKAAGQLIATATAAGIGAVASGGSTAGAAMGLNIDANNRQLHPTEIQRIKQLAGVDAAKEARLTAAACALVRCYAEYPEGSAAYQQLFQLATLGASDGLMAERQQLSNQSGLFGYATTGLLSDSNSDAIRQLNNTYHIGARAVGGGQAVLGVAGVATGVVTAPASCVTGVGCVVSAALVGISADTAYAGAKQVVSGQSESTMLNQALQSLGMSAEAASYAEFALGVGAAAKVAAVLDKSIEHAIELSKLSVASYESFATKGVTLSDEIMQAPQAQALVKEIQECLSMMQFDMRWVTSSQVCHFRKLELLDRVARWSKLCPRARACRNTPATG